tara:strand:+ start:6504 stop:7727 length:1224 start_codon:yes stop_codon:yes gene_type:complete
MNVEYFISKRLFTAKEKNNRYTRPILRIAILAIALSVAVMLLSLTVLTGFKNEISSKVIGFGSHITITNFSDNYSYDTEPIEIDQDFYLNLMKIEGVKHVQDFATKAGIIKTDSEILGIVIKGVNSNFDPSFFEQNLLEGEVPKYNDTVISSKLMISRNVAAKLELNLGDRITIYFVENSTRVRQFIISGIYSTGFTDFDDLIAIVDIQHIQKLNNWGDMEIGGLEIFIDNFEILDQLTEEVNYQIPYDFNAENIKDRNPQLFDWLDLQDINVRVILILMLIVGGVNMITALLILILERTKLIGILKALGVSNWSIRKVFIYNALYLIMKGLFLGNIIGLGFAFLQKKFHLVSLDSNVYYMNTVPVEFNLIHIFGLNISTLIICWLALLIPSFLITKILPMKSIRFS